MIFDDLHIIIRNPLGHNVWAAADHVARIGPFLAKFCDDVFGDGKTGAVCQKAGQIRCGLIQFKLNRRRVDDTRPQRRQRLLTSIDVLGILNDEHHRRIFRCRFGIENSSQAKDDIRSLNRLTVGPHHAFAQFEGPRQAVGRCGPTFRNTGNGVRLSVLGCETQKQFAGDVAFPC